MCGRHEKRSTWPSEVVDNTYYFLFSGFSQLCNQAKTTWPPHGAVQLISLRNIFKKYFSNFLVASREFIVSFVRVLSKSGIYSTDGIVMPDIHRLLNLPIFNPIVPCAH